MRIETERPVYVYISASHTWFFFFINYLKGAQLGAIGLELCAIVPLSKYTNRYLFEINGTYYDKDKW